MEFTNYDYFQKKIEELSKPLKDSEIELRIGSTFKDKGFTLLAYKTARVDVDRLNSVFGLYWSNDFELNTKDQLIGKISIFDGDRWVTRCDVGVESFTEEIKGNFSDAFKRAGFKWGIGKELYDFPFIWINWTDWNEKKPKGANVQSWYIKYKGNDFRNGFTIYNEKSVSVYEFKGIAQSNQIKQEEKSSENNKKEEKIPATKDIKFTEKSDIKELAVDLKEKLVDKKINIVEFSEAFGINKNPETVKLCYEVFNDRNLIEFYLEFYLNCKKELGKESNLKKFIDKMKISKEKLISISANKNEIKALVDFYKTK